MSEHFNSLSEASIRDYLANNLHLIEEGLVLVKKEKLLKNDVGARGFIDIFARSKNGIYYVIEIKKSKATSRETIQELLKYSNLLRKNISLRENEFKLIVLSVEWDELLTPFSEFVNGTNFPCCGYKIIKNDLISNDPPQTTEKRPSVA